MTSEQAAPVDDGCGRHALTPGRRAPKRRRRTPGEVLTSIAWALLVRPRRPRYR